MQLPTAIRRDLLRFRRGADLDAPVFPPAAGVATCTLRAAQRAVLGLAVAGWAERRSPPISTLGQ